MEELFAASGAPRRPRAVVVEVTVARAELLLRAIGVWQEEIESRTAQVRRELALSVPQVPVVR